MIFLKTEDEIELLRQSNLLVGKTLAEVAKLVKPGVTTRELDKVALCSGNHVYSNSFIDFQM